MNEPSLEVQNIMKKLTQDEISTLANYFTKKVNDSGSKSRKYFSEQEDMHLKELVKKYGTSNWTVIANEMPNRTVRQCRERYRHYLSPDVCQRPWSAEEDALILSKFTEFGSKWVKISKFFDKRTDIDVKNRWVVLMRKNASLPNDETIGNDLKTLVNNERNDETYTIYQPFSNDPDIDDPTIKYPFMLYNPMFKIY